MVSRLNLCEEDFDSSFDVERSLRAVLTRVSLISSLAGTEGCCSDTGASGLFSGDIRICSSYSVSLGFTFLYSVLDTETRVVLVSAVKGFFIFLRNHSLIPTVKS